MILNLSISKDGKRNIHIQNAQLRGVRDSALNLKPYLVKPWKSLPDRLSYTSEILVEQENQSKQELLEDLEGLETERHSVIEQRIKRYNGIVVELKREYNSRCQIENCSFTFRKRNGQLYSEGHHLIWLSKGGSQASYNVVILCPNHYRMLHYAEVVVGERSGKRRNLKINGEPYFIVY